MRPIQVRQIKLAVAVGLLAWGTSSQAALVDLGATTLDTATGLSWLDLTASNGQSYNQVSAQFGAGGQFAGYRYATQGEVLTFWSHAGLNPPPVDDYYLYYSANASNTDQASTAAYLNLVGITLTQGSTPVNYYALGLYAPSTVAAQAGFGDVYIAGTAVQWFADPRYLGLNQSVSGIGSFLVTSAVPESGSAVLMLAGCLGVAGMVSARRSGNKSS